MIINTKQGILLIEVIYTTTIIPPIQLLEVELK